MLPAVNLLVAFIVVAGRVISTTTRPTKSTNFLATSLRRHRRRRRRALDKDQEVMFYNWKTETFSFSYFAAASLWHKIENYSVNVLRLKRCPLSIYFSSVSWTFSLTATIMLELLTPALKRHRQESGQGESKRAAWRTNITEWHNWPD